MGSPHLCLAGRMLHLERGASVHAPSGLKLIQPVVVRTCYKSTRKALPQETPFPRGCRGTSGLCR